MSKSKRPVRIVVQGEHYVAAVLKVTERDSSGPRTFRLLRDDETTTVEGGEEFWVVYAAEDLIVPVSRLKN